MDYPSTPAPGAKTVTAHNGDQITYSVDATAPFAINAWNAATPNPENAPFWHQPRTLHQPTCTCRTTSFKLTPHPARDTSATTPHIRGGLRAIKKLFKDKHDRRKRHHCCMG